MTDIRNAEITLVQRDMIFGHAEMDQRLVATGDGGWQGESRLRQYDRNGALTEVTPWIASGARITWAEPR